MTSEYVADHRERMERQRLEAAQRREQERIEQRSEQNSPDARVRIWERLHHLTMPADAAHPILVVIAQQTALSLKDVLEVQRQRSSVSAE
jgi:hypothetical protein